MRPIPSLIFVVAATCLLNIAPQAQAYNFFRIGLLPGTTITQSYAVSGNGAVVVGACGDGHTGTPWRWTAEGGIQAIPIPTGAAGAAAESVSGDGTVACVVANTGSTYLWTAQGGFVIADQVGPTHARLSTDANVIYGQQSDHGFRWSVQAGLTNLPDIYDVFGSDATGSKLVGYSNHPYIGTDGHFYTAHQPTIWTADTGYTHVQTASGLPVYGVLTGSSDDGRVVAGIGDDELNLPGQNAFFTGPYAIISGTGIVPVPLPSSSTLSVSGNGQVFASGNMLWDMPSNTYTTIAHAGWTSIAITGLNSTGSVVTGTGVFQNRQESWVVTIPAPGAAGPFACGAVGLLRRRRGL